MKTEKINPMATKRGSNSEEALAAQLRLVPDEIPPFR
jgi:hypothetical protein